MSREQAAALHSDHLHRRKARSETSPTKFDSWSTDEELTELDDLEEMDMEMDEESGDERVVIPPRRPDVKVHLDVQGRHMAFSVGSPLSQPTLAQQQAAAVRPATSVPFTFVPTVPTITNPYPAVMMVPVQQVYPTMGLSWAQPTMVFSQQLLP